MLDTYLFDKSQPSSWKMSKNLHILCFISNPVPERPVDDSKNFDGVAYIA